MHLTGSGGQPHDSLQHGRNRIKTELNNSFATTNSYIGSVIDSKLLTLYIYVSNIHLNNYVRNLFSLMLSVRSYMVYLFVFPQKLD